MSATLPVGEGEPCLRCFRLSWSDRLRPECIMPVPKGDDAPIAVAPPGHVDHNMACCIDCAAADTILKLKYVPGWTKDPRDYASSFAMARVVVGNDRQEQFRLPGAPMGMVYHGIVRPSAPGDLEKHHRWMDEKAIPWRGEHE